MRINPNCRAPAAVPSSRLLCTYPYLLTVTFANKLVQRLPPDGFYQGNRERDQADGALSTARPPPGHLPPSSSIPLRLGDELGGDLRDEPGKGQICARHSRPSPWPDFYPSSLLARPPCLTRARKEGGMWGEREWRRGSEARKLVPFPCVLVMTGERGGSGLVLFGGVSQK